MIKKYIMISKFLRIVVAEVFYDTEQLDHKMTGEIQYNQYKPKIMEKSHRRVYIKMGSKLTHWKKH